MALTIPARVAERAATRYVVAASGCWETTYSRIGGTPYGQIGWQDGPERHMTTVHRAAWVHYAGQPGDLTVDHVCHNGACVRPDHLRLLTNVENATDNGSEARRTSVEVGRLCRRGHPLVENPDSPQAFCLTCGGIRRRRHRAKVPRSNLRG